MVGGKWGDDERLLRLNMMQPPWLRLRVAMYWLDIHLNIGVNSGNDLETLVSTLSLNCDPWDVCNNGILRGFCLVTIIAYPRQPYMHGGW